MAFGRENMNIDDKEFSKGELRMLLRAVKRVLTNSRNITRNNAALRDTSIHIGLVTKDECDLG